MPKGLEKKSLAKAVFDELFEHLDQYFAVSMNPTGVLNAGGVDSYLEKRNWYKAASKHAALRRLERQKYLTVRKRGAKMHVQLTEKGFEYALKQRVIEKKQKYSDNKICFVSFDIPQHVSHIRSALRFLLKEARFTMVHQSLWACRRDIGNEMALFVKHLHAEDWINVSVATSLTTIESMKKSYDKSKRSRQNG